MKKFYVSPAIEVSAFVAEDIVCASTITVDGLDYDVVSKGVSVNSGGVQRIDTAQQSEFTFD